VAATGKEGGGRRRGGEGRNQWWHENYSKTVSAWECGAINLKKIKASDPQSIEHSHGKISREFSFNLRKKPRNAEVAFRALPTQSEEQKKADFSMRYQSQG